MFGTPHCYVVNPVGKDRHLLGVPAKSLDRFIGYELRHGDELIDALLMDFSAERPVQFVAVESDEQSLVPTYPGGVPYSIPQSPLAQDHVG